MLLNPFCTFSTAKVLALKPTVLLLFQTLGSWPSAVGVCSQLGGAALVNPQQRREASD